MTAVLAALTLGAFVLLVLVTFVQILYLESLRLRARDLPALEYFKETLEERIGLKSEAGAFTYSLVKHSLLVALGVLVLGLLAPLDGVTVRTVLEALLFSWIIMMLATYLVPQVLYRRTTGQWMLPLVPVVKGVALVARPVTGLLGFLQSLSDLHRDAAAEAGEASSTAEDIDALIAAGAEEGLIEEEDRKLIQSVVAFGDKTVREVMTPRPNLVAISCDKTLEDLRQLVIHEQYSRIPVYKESIDNIIGFVHVRDMFELEARERVQQVRELMRPIRFVPETKPVNDLLREMQADGAHMAIVVDEYGNTAGLTTMEDMVEEILGEIRDEHEPTHDVMREPDGSYIVSGSFDLDHLHELLEFRAEEQTESTTVGGLVTEWLGRVPQAGESVEREGIRLEVMAGNELRVEQVRISRAVPDSAAPVEKAAPHA